METRRSQLRCPAHFAGFASATRAQLSPEPSVYLNYKETKNILFDEVGGYHRYVGQLIKPADYIGILEINNPSANKNDKFYVTNGLLTVELMSGKIQTGNNSYQNAYPAAIPMVPVRPLSLAHPF